MGHIENVPDRRKNLAYRVVMSMGTLILNSRTSKYFLEFHIMEIIKTRYNVFSRNLKRDMFVRIVRISIDGVGLSSSEGLSFKS